MGKAKRAHRLSSFGNRGVIRRGNRYPETVNAYSKTVNTYPETVNTYSKTVNAYSKTVNRAYLKVRGGVG